MKIWIVNVNEPLPTDPGYDRPWRMGMLWDALRSRRHDVTWWSSTVHHFDKRLRYDRTTEVAVDDLARVIHLHGRLYRRNISLARLQNHRTLGLEFRRLAPQKPRPDIILASIPILDLPREAVRFGRASELPVVVDVRDKWPDFMVEQVPGLAKPLARLLLRPLFHDLHEACSGARAVIGVTPAFVDWGLRAAGRAGTTDDRYVPHGYPETAAEASLLDEAGRFWDALDIRAGTGLPVLSFIGSLNFTAFDFPALIQAMGLLRGQARLVLCGSGVGQDRVRELVAGADNILLPGWVDGPRLQVLMQRSRLGVAPYRNRANFVDNLPNKFLEYLSQGLPVLSCLEGFSRQVLEEGGVGLFYPEAGPAELAHQVRTFLTDPEGSRAMEERARRLFHERFQAAKVYGELADHLVQLAEET